MELSKFSLLLVSYVAIASVANLFSSVEGRLKLYKTIKTEDGSIYDCVDIYKQPAFDHPLLKNHKIQMQPSFALQRMPNNTSSTSTTKFGLKDECPRGTVPIRRMSKEKQLRSGFSLTQDPGRPPTGLEFAGVSTKPGNYQGGAGFVSIYNPPADNDQFSASVISFEGGPREEFSTIKAGWMVNPSQFGDSLTHLYTLWGQGVNGVMQGCYDTSCPGFVIVSSQVPLNLVFTNISVAGGTQFYFKLTITMDLVSGHWWLLYSDKDGDPDKEIGYWPNQLFKHLKQGAEIIRWGGMVYSNKAESPPMGSGGGDCRYRRITIASDDLNDRFKLSDSRCYKVGTDSHTGEFWGYNIWFGGPGGDTRHCY